MNVGVGKGLLRPSGINLTAPCEAYVKSQAGEGWRALATAYDDGGYSGGSIERPALKMLLADITAGKVDVVVVYKIDRLTRSLTDFARMVELFDAKSVSFVSVTQAFNTTTSMGRLTLNVLLSFAQFEREVTGERIRDKIAASKAKGMWMGGVPPLGYDLPTDSTTRALVVNEAEAAIVRLIFATYRDLGSAHALQRWLAERDIRSKARTTAKGREIGGEPFSRGALFHLLRNRLYTGVIVHKDKVHPGAHPAIVEQDVFHAAQAMLDAGARRRNAHAERVATAALRGRIFDADGEPMCPTFAHGARGQVYRYYVSAPLQQGQRRDPGDDAIRRVPATIIEAALTQILGRLLPTSSVDPLARVLRIEVYREQLHILLAVAMLQPIRARLGADEYAVIDEADPSRLRLSVPMHMVPRSSRVSVIGSDAEASPGVQRDPALIKALRAAHAMVHQASNLPCIEAAPTTTYARRILRLAFLAPELQAAILEGRQPPGLTMRTILAAAPALLWSEQIAAFEG